MAQPIDALGQLSDQHRKVLVSSSGLHPDIIAGRGYRSLDRTEVATLAARQQYVFSIMKGEGWLSIPIYRPNGERYGELVRLDKQPKGWSMKYVWPTDAPQVLDIHPLARDYVRDMDVPLVITEGIKKADAILSAALRENTIVCPVALNGAGGWRGRIGPGAEATAALSDWADIPLQKRRIVLVPDSDYQTNSNVKREWDNLFYYLAGKSGDTKVSLAVVPSRGLEKQGADDFLLTSSLDDLLGRASSLELVAVVPPITELRYKTLRETYDSAALSIPMLVNGMLAERGVGVIAGHSATFKTWHVMRLCLDLAQGRPFLGHPELSIPRAGRSVYVNREMDEVSFGSRIKRLIDHEAYAGARELLDREDSPILLLDDASFDLADLHATALFKQFLLDQQPLLVVLDSLSMCWSGDENSASEVGRLYKVLRTLVQETGVTFLILHHLTKPSKERPGFSMFHVRGSGQIIQQADTALLLSHYQGAAEGEQMIQIRHEKSRHGIELPMWLTRFTEDDMRHISVAYEGKVSEMKSQDYAAASGAIKKQLRIDLVRAVFDDQSPMMRAQGGLTLDYAMKSFNSVLPQGEKSINLSALRRDIDKLVEQGVLEVVRQGGSNPDRYKLTEPDDEDE